MRYLTILFFAVLSFACAGCSREERAPSAPAGRVSATPAYQRYFGPPPTSNAGSCFAFVIYFPSARTAGKCTPFPFFTFDEGSVKRVALERLVAGMDVGSYRGEFSNPFPPGARLASLTEKEGIVTADFGAAPAADQVPAARQAAVLTLAQFPGVKGVRVSFPAQPAGAPASADAGAVLEPGPPRILAVSAAKEKGKGVVEDVSVLFDRPLEIKELQMTDAAGRPFSGDTYHSVFDMAAVLKPKDPAAFQAAMPIRVRWSVVDKKGRAAKGESTLPLEVHEH